MKLSELIRQNLSACVSAVLLVAAFSATPAAGQAAPAPNWWAKWSPKAPPLGAQDGFESPTLGSLWMTGLLAPGSWAVQSDIVRAGHSALRITVRPHDFYMPGNPGTSDTERDELMEAFPYWTRENVPYEFSWSMYVAKDFPVVPVRLVVAQWWEWCHASNLPCSGYSPVLAVRYIGGELLITQDLNQRYNVLYREKRDLRGRWLDLRFQVRFTPEATGFVRAWLDGKQVVDFNGATLNQENAQSGYGPPVLIPFRMGLYRNPMPEPMTIYLDEYRKSVMGQDGK